MNEKISIIVPVYNVELYLERCIYSLLNQTYKNIEVILVNDGSEDNSSTLCDQYSKKDPRIIVIHQENQGISVVRNEGIKVATGEYICFVDSDDYVALNYIEQLYTLLVNHNACISMCNFAYFHGNMVTDNDMVTKEKEVLILSKQDILINMHVVKGELYMVVWGKLFKTEIFKNIKFPQGRICEDLAVLYKLYDKTKKTVYSNEILYYYFRNNESSLTFKINHRFYEDVAIALEEEITYMKEKGHSDILPYVKKTYMYWMLDYYRKLRQPTDKEKRKKILQKYRELHKSIKYSVTETMYKLFYYMPNIYVRIKK